MYFPQYLEPQNFVYTIMSVHSKTYIKPKPNELLKKKLFDL